MLMVRMELTEDASLAAMRARSKFGMAMAAMIRIIAITISSSISEKPFCFRISFSLFSRNQMWSQSTQTGDNIRILSATSQVTNGLRTNLLGALFSESNKSSVIDDFALPRRNRCQILSVC